MALVVRQDLRMSGGKVAAQCSHAALGAALKAKNLVPEMYKRWMKIGPTKIALRVKSEKELLEIEEVAKSHKLITYKVKDAGLTQIAPGSITVLAIGPAPLAKIDEVTKKYSLL